MTTYIPPMNNTQKPAWWNRPILGEEGVFNDLLHQKSKQEVSESVIVLHSEAMVAAKVLAKTVEQMDNEKFSNAEFLQWVRMKYAIALGLDQYQNLAHSIELLQVAIEAKDSFIALDQIELQYRCSKQQYFYHHVEDELKTFANLATFRQHTQDTLAKLLPQIKTERGKNALTSYAEHLDHVSEHKLGLKLLARFKMYQLGDYSILRIVSEMIQSLNKYDLLNFKGIVGMVQRYYHVFEQLRRIIGVSPAQHNPETYALIIQYIALSYRHGLSYVMFEQLLNQIRNWSKSYHSVIKIRETYPPTEYKQPKDFSESIAGLEIYLKYKKSLSDPNTGMIYVNLDE